MPVERDLPVGHPSASDTVLGSTEHKQWLRDQAAKSNQRDFPPGHPKASDTPGSDNSLTWRDGVDPRHPEMEAHTGRTPEQAARIRDYNLERSREVQASRPVPPVDAQRVNEAVAARMRELGVQELTPEQHAEVVGRLTYGRRASDRQQ